MKEIKVKLDKQSYRILIGSGVYNKLTDEIDRLKLNRNMLLIIDENVQKFHKKYINGVFKKYSGNIKQYIFKSGENSKSYRELNNIYSFLIKNNFGRDSLIAAVGGGVVGDAAGFAASAYMRGVQLIHIPTTLLAAVDSSIGGKTGINFEKKKNIIGAFYQPNLVLADTNFLATLPEKEITSGMGEIIKYAFLADDDFFSFINEGFERIYEKDEETLQDIIYRSALLKASVVAEDEREHWLRKTLNFGHTFAHAIESNLNFKVKHGEAVTMGIICALFLSNKIGVINKDEMERLRALPLKVKLPKILNSINLSEVYEIMKLDKKSRSGKINFVLTSGIGKTLINVEAGKHDIFYSIKKAKDLITD